MAINLSALAPLTSKATALTNLLLVTPNAAGYQPQNTPAIGGFFQSLLQQPAGILFHYEGEQSVGLESDITDHYIEDNTAVQDQIALKPVTITTHGFIGELNDVPPPALALLKTAVDKLTTISAYTPALSVTAQIAYNEAFLAYQLAANVGNAAIAAWSSLTGSPAQNRQQTVFQQFYGYWQSRTLFKCQTPWAQYENMAIKTLRAIQDAETKVITDFEVTFKQIRNVNTAFGSGLKALFAGHADAQSSDVVNNGTSSGTPGPSVNQGISSTENP